MDISEPHTYRQSELASIKAYGEACKELETLEAVVELLNAENLEQARLLGMSGSREAALLSRTETLETATKQAMIALIDIEYTLQKSRMWAGTDWTYNPMHPVKYLPLVDKAQAALAALQNALGEKE